MIDKEFDNDDNPFVKMSLTMNSNFKNKDIDQKLEIPLVKCTGKPIVTDKLKKTWYYGQFYCPDFSDQHYMYQNYFNDVSSWLKFRIDKCNSTER